MTRVLEIADGQVKSRLTETILRDLPEWFGIERAICDYVRRVRDYTLFAAYDGDDAVGVLSIKSNNVFSAEIYVMAVLRSWHRRGIGHRLLTAAERHLERHDYRFLMVKTLSDSRDCEPYARTRAFYRHEGFYPLDEIPEIWGADNPCLLMVKGMAVV